MIGELLRVFNPKKKLCSMTAAAPELMATVPNGASVVDMVSYNDAVIVATSDNRLYQLGEDGVFTLIQFKMEDE